MPYAQILRRTREHKTNYTKRRQMLVGKRDFITVKISNENTQVQIHRPRLEGDKVMASAQSRFLIKKGWKGSRKNLPAAYLTGYLAGKRAAASGIKDAILYSGSDKYTQRMAAGLKGVIDAGVNVPAAKDSFPPENRLNGEHLTVKNDIEKIKAAIDNEVSGA